MHGPAGAASGLQGARSHLSKAFLSPTSSIASAGTGRFLDLLNTSVSGPFRCIHAAISHSTAITWPQSVTSMPAISVRAPRHIPLVDSRLRCSGHLGIRRTAAGGSSCCETRWHICQTSSVCRRRESGVSCRSACCSSNITLAMVCSGGVSPQGSFWRRLGCFVIYICRRRDGDMCYLVDGGDPAIPPQGLRGPLGDDGLRKVVRGQSWCTRGRSSAAQGAAGSLGGWWVPIGGSWGYDSSSHAHQAVSVIRQGTVIHNPCISCGCTRRDTGFDRAGGQAGGEKGWD